MTSRSRSVAAPLVLVSLVTALTVELVRASGPMFDRAFNAGVVVAAVVALVTYATPGIVVTALARGRTVTGRTGHTGVVVLGVARLAVQAPAAAPTERVPTTPDAAYAPPGQPVET